MVMPEFKPSESSDVYWIIEDAIRNRKIVTAVFGGKVRIMCPHTLGLNKAGSYQMLAYQFAGESNSGLGPDGSGDNWRCLPLDKLSNVTSYVGPWHTAPTHSRPQTCVKLVYVEVAY
jgi:hypothetical protein